LMEIEHDKGGSSGLKFIISLLVGYRY